MKPQWTENHTQKQAPFQLVTQKTHLKIRLSNLNFDFMKELDFDLCEGYIDKILESISKIINDKSYNSIKHYLGVAEYEMAFEILFTEIINNNYPVTIDKQECLSIALMLRLDKESVYDPSFWVVLNQWLSSK